MTEGARRATRLWKGFCCLLLLAGLAVWLLNSQQGGVDERIPAPVPQRARAVAVESAESPPAAPPARRLVDIAHERGLPLPLPSPSIRVRKAAHALELSNDGTLLKTYAVGLGKDRSGSSMAEAGPKRRQGDRKTPEGVYRIVSRHDRGPFHLWMALGYPNAEDAERGLAEGAIGPRLRDQIARADRAGAEPPAKTTLGGDVGIHGGGSGSDWTFGCVALEDRDVEELWRAVPNGTKVEILP